MIRTHVGFKLTQGSIFSCAQAEDYAGCDVYGLIITARCDTAHDKASVYNYLPVVKFDDWLHRDFRSALIARCETDLQQQFSSILKGNDVSGRVVATHSPQQIVDIFFPENAEEKSIRKARTQALECVRRFALLERARRSGSAERMIIQIADEFSKLKDRLIKECVHQQMGGYYFLPRIEADGADPGFVVLMREVRHMPRVFSSLIAQGLDNESYKRACQENAVQDNVLTFGRNDFSYCVGRLESPSVEHLMQTFSLLFGRIGLPDPDSEYIGRLWKSQPSVSAKEEK